MEQIEGTFTMSDLTPIVYVVDDDVLTRRSLAGLICEAGWQASVFASAAEFLSCSCAVCPSCLVLDVILPGLNGLDLQRRVAGDRADIPIIFVSGHSDVPTTVQAMKAGAIDFLTKPFDEDALLAAIGSALDRSHATQEAALETAMLQGRYMSLSPRERQVMGLVISGVMNKQVGGELEISEITVKAHRGRVMKKMSAHSLAELVDIATKLKIPRQRLSRSSRKPRQLANPELCADPRFNAYGSSALPLR
jgi:FixJ family two-component response regulator